MAEKINKALIQLSTSGVSSAYPMTLAVGVKEAHGGSGLTDVLDDIYAQLGTGGTVEQKIQKAIGELNADVTGTSTDNHVSVVVKEESGIVTSVVVTEDIEDTIDSKINELDSEITSNNDANLTVSVTESEGLITSVTASGNYSSVSTAKTGTENTTLSATSGLVKGSDIETVANFANTRISEELGKLNATKESTGGTHVKVTVAEASGVVTAITVAETDIASNSELQSVSGTLNTAITAEVTRATGKEAELAAAITAEVTRATSKEAELAAAITAEETRATGKEAELATAITAEVTRATVKEEALEELIETLSGKAVTSVNGQTGNTVVVDGGDIKLDGYTIAATATSISSADTVNIALGKLEKGLEDAVAGGVTSVLSGNGISVDTTNPHTPKVSAVVDTTAYNGVALTLDSTNGIGVSVDAVEDANGIVAGAINVVTAGAVAEKIASLDMADSAVTTQYVSSVSEEDGIITVGRTDLVASGDKVLATNDDGNLISTLNFTYDSDARIIKLTGKDSAVIGEVDASDFIKDGMLWGEKAFVASATTETVSITKGSVTKSHEFTSLTVGHQYLAFCFTDGAVPTATYSWDIVDLQNLVDVYTAGDGLVLDDHEFSVKLASGSEDFLTVDENGLKLSGVSAAISAAVQSLDVEETTVTATKESSSTDVAAEFKYSETNGKVSITDFKLTDVASKTDLGAEATAREEGDTDTLASAKTYTDTVVSGLDATVSATTTEGGLQVIVTEADGKLTSLTFNERVAGKDSESSPYHGGVMSAAQAEKLDNSITYEVVENLDPEPTI